MIESALAGETVDFAGGHIFTSSQPYITKTAEIEK